MCSVVTFPGFFVIVLVAVVDDVSALVDMTRRIVVVGVDADIVEG